MRYANGGMASLSERRHPPAAYAALIEAVSPAGRDVDHAVADSPDDVLGRRSGNLRWTVRWR